VRERKAAIALRIQGRSQCGASRAACPRVRPSGKWRAALGTGHRLAPATAFARESNVSVTPLRATCITPDCATVAVRPSVARRVLTKIQSG